MTNRERFHAVLNNKMPDDRLPVIEWAMWWRDRTVARWENDFGRELPYGDALFQFLGLDVHRQFWLNAAGPGCPKAPFHGAGILKTAAVVSGLAGCGKTSFLLDYFRDKKRFYFSFAGLEESIAERLFAEKISVIVGREIANWDEAFIALSKEYKYIVFDDLAPIASYKRFKNSFYENMLKDFQSRPLVFLISQPTDNLDRLADEFDQTNLNYFSIPEVIKLSPKLSKHDILGLCAVSGGITKILREYDEQKTFEDNLRHMLQPDSAFINFMPCLWFLSNLLYCTNVDSLTRIWVLWSQREARSLSV